MTTLRSLIAELGFQVDTTPADRFNAAVKRSKKTVNSLNQVNLSAFNSRLGKAFKIGLGVVSTGLAGITSLISADAARKIIGVEEELKFRFKGLFDPLKDEIESILANDLLGRLTTRLELFEAANVLAQQGFSGNVITRNLENILRVSVLFRQNLGEGTQSFLQILQSGDISQLVKLGKFTAEQAQIIQKAQVGFEKVGIPQRIKIIEDIFRDLAPVIDKRIQALVERGALSQDKLLNTFDRLNVAIGEVLLPTFKRLNDAIIPFIDRVTKVVKGEAGITSLIPTTAEEIKELEITPIIIRAFLKEFPKLRDFILPSISQIDRTGAQGTQGVITTVNLKAPTQIDRTGAAGTQGLTRIVNISVPIKIESGATGDPTVIRRVVKQQMSETFGKSIEQNQNNTLIRGKGGAQ